MNKVNNFCVGVPKSGSSSLWDYFKLYSQVSVGMQKEPGAFLEENFDLSRYHSLYDLKKISIDFTVEYCSNEIYLDRVYAYNPDAKIILIIRDPIAREISHLTHRFSRDGSNPSEENLKLLAEKYGRYGTIYERINSIFPKANILCVTLESLQSEKKDTLKQVCEFIGLEFNAEYEFPKSNIGGVPRIFFINKVIKFISDSSIPKILPLFLRKYLANLKEKIFEINKTKNKANINFTPGMIDYSSELNILKKNGIDLPQSYNKYFN